MKYPVSIETERLVTRPLSELDELVWEVFMANEEATRFFPNPDNLSSAEWARTWINKQLARYEEGRYGLQALIDKKTGEFIGQCGLLTHLVDEIEELEVGYSIMPQFWGQGFASEAAIAFKNLAFENNLADSIISIIDVNNIASQKVAAKNGMQVEKDTVFWTMNVHIFRIWRSQWLLK